MLEEILPACAAAVETREEILDQGLFPAEAAIVERAVEKRRREFTTGRACARRALGRLGLLPGPIPTGAAGAPVWPSGVVGSITHCDGYRACAVAHSHDLLTLGIDAEPNDPLPDGLIAEIALPQERGRVRELTGEAPEVRWDRLLFSLKEAVYKAWFPLTGKWLGFEDAAITLDREGGTFSASLLVPGPRLRDGELTTFSGNWLVRDGLVLAAIAVAADRGRILTGDKHSH